MRMRQQLVRQLRICSPADREKTAIHLARCGSDEAVGELIRMVEGKRKHGLRHYDYEDQLIAMRALGESGRKEALEYLERLYTPVKSTPLDISTRTAHREEGAYILATHEKTHMDFPNARKELRERLAYEVNTCYDIVNVRGLRMPSRRKSRETDNRDKVSHETISAAIERLKTKLQAQ